MIDSGHLNIPLSGCNLIDASAGTGKTYAICGLVLRLLLEKELTIRQILVLTYTEAATEDLRFRVREKIRQALDGLNSSNSDDDIICQLIKRYPEGDPDTTKARQRLNDALRDFDEAAIFTIHGFCHQILRENSLETGFLFDSELLTDQQDLLREIVEDFWRDLMYQDSRLSDIFSTYIYKQLQPESLLAFLNKYQNQPFLEIIPDLSADTALADLQHLELAFAQAHTEVCKNWPTAKEEVTDALASSNSLKRNIYRVKNIPDWIAAMDMLVAAHGNEHPDPDLFKGFEKFTSGEIKRACKKDHQPLSLPFFDLCDHLLQSRSELLAAFDNCLTALKIKLFNLVKEELAVRKQQSKTFSFDDLLSCLYRALNARKGVALARSVLRRYPAALIDEFQDTDPLQYGILSTIYLAPPSAGSDQGMLFLIGDPKQAIYSFRGADIFTYMRAAAAIKGDDSHQTLGRNWRSSPEMINAVNTIFSRATNPFIFKDIPFAEVEAADTEHAETVINGMQEPPFQLWFFPRSRTTADDQSNRQISKSAARQMILPAVAAEISRLLKLGDEQQALINNNKLTANDIAVLVRTNKEARLMQNKLAALRIPSVLHSAENLFSSYEAFELELVLKAVAEPGKEQLTRAAMATDILGVSNGDIGLAGEDDKAACGVTEKLEPWLIKIRRYYELWCRSGFMPMFRMLMSENNVGPRLLACLNGERRLTNLNHLAELLHRTDMERSLGMTGLLTCLAEQRAKHESADEDYQLRLERDAECVRIVTVHKAKGLEYSVVFCPFVWEGPQLPAKNEYLFHRPTGSNAETEELLLTLDLGSPDSEQHRQLAVVEKLSEDLRLLYVALTRARYRCYMIWGAFSGVEKSGAAYLLHQPQLPDSAGSLADNSKPTRENTIDHVKKLSDDEILKDLEELRLASKNAIQLTVREETTATSYNRTTVETVDSGCRVFHGIIKPGWRISSFSSLVSGQSYQVGPGIEDPDRDNILPTEDAKSKLTAFPGPGIFHFPHGTRAGNFFHDLLENLDFTLTETDGYIADKLREHGFDPIWLRAVRETVNDLLNIPLLPDRPKLTLSTLSNEMRLNELEFYFPLEKIGPKDLGKIFKAHSRQLPDGFCGQLEKLTFSPAKGFMKGFIDLVFKLDNRYFLIDWKSNFLGTDIEDYHAAKLAKVMNSGFYTLQYHIYTLALHQYLKRRLHAYEYGRHFGGVLYVFLRGVKLERGLDFGFFHDRPEESLITELADRLINTEHKSSLLKNNAGNSAA